MPVSAAATSVGSTFLVSTTTRSFGSTKRSFMPLRLPIVASNMDILPLVNGYLVNQLLCMERLHLFVGSKSLLASAHSVMTTTGVWGHSRWRNQNCQHRTYSTGCSLVFHASSHRFLGLVLLWCLITCPLIVHTNEQFSITSTESEQL